MPRLIWTPRAVQDLQRLRQFLANYSPTAASRAIQAIRKAAGQLLTCPQGGRPVEESDNRLREWPVSFGHSGYLILYQFADPNIIVVSVKHQREAGY